MPEQGVCLIPSAFEAGFASSASGDGLDKIRDALEVFSASLQDGNLLASNSYPK